MKSADRSVYEVLDELLERVANLENPPKKETKKVAPKKK